MNQCRWSYGAAVLAATIVLGTLVGCELPSGPRVDPRQAIIDARWTLEEAAEGEDPFTKSQALEALARTVGREAGAVFAKALKDTNPAVRFAGGMAIGDVQYLPAKDTLLDLAKVGEEAEQDKRVYCAVIYALYRLGDSSYLNQLGSLLFDEEPEVRANAALVMGRMRIRAAVDPLRDLISGDAARDSKVRLNAVEALAKLGDRRSIGILESYAKWPVLDFRLVAINAMGEVDSDRSRRVLVSLLKSPLPRVRAAAGGALAKLSEVDETTYEYCLLAAENPQRVLQKAHKTTVGDEKMKAASLQELAVKALGEMNRKEALEALHPLLKSPHGGVRVAAAMSILKLLRDHPHPGASTESAPLSPPPSESSKHDGH